MLRSLSSPMGSAQHQDALVRWVQCPGTMTVLFPPGGVLGSPQPAWESLSRVFLLSLLLLHRNVVEKKKTLLTIYLPYLNLIHLQFFSLCTDMSAHKCTLFCVQSCNSDQIFSLRCRNINFLSTPLRLAPLLFFHPWHTRRKDNRFGLHRYMHIHYLKC